MSNDNDDTNVVGLLALGVLVAVGAGVWLVCKAFGDFENGEEVTEDDLEEAGYTPPPQKDKEDDEEHSGPEQKESAGQCRGFGCTRTDTIVHGCGAITCPAHLVESGGFSTCWSCDD